VIFKVVSFDAEGTLVTRRFSQVIWEEAIPKLYSEKKGIGFDDAKARVMREYAEIGDGRVEWYDIRYWFDHFGLTNPERLLNEHRQEIALYPEASGVLRDLCKNHKLIVSSNSSREFLKLELKKLERYFYRVYSVTSDFRRVKKTNQVYEKICRLLGIRPSEMVHVGDLLEDDFKAPRKVGVLSYHLDRTAGKSDEFVLKDLGEFKARIEEQERASSPRTSNMLRKVQVFRRE
jgi:HAD superfamily hydrolase (TIGR01549 family)